MKIGVLIGNIFSDLVLFLKKKENRLPAGLFLAAFAGLAVYTVIRAADPVNPTDFGNHFYNATREILYRYESIFGKYNYNSYPPLFYCLIAPFAIFTKPVAAFLWYLVSFAGLVLTVGLAADMLKKDLVSRRVNILIPVLLLGFVIADNLYLGQSNFLPLALMTASIWFDQNKKELPAGVMLGLAIAVKITPALLLVYFLVERKWITLLFAFLAFFLSVYLVPMLFFGIGDASRLTTEWFNRVIFPFLTGQKLQTDTITYSSINQSLEGVLARYLTPFGRDTYGGLFAVINPGWSDFQLGILVKTLKAVFLGLTVLLHLLYSDRKLVPLSFYIYALLLISPVSWTNHYYLLAVPYIVLFNFVLVKWKGKMRTAGFVAFGTGTALTLFSVTPALQAYGFLFIGNFLIFATLYALFIAQKIPQIRMKFSKKF